ncbi:MAG TPA: flagellar biosynthesis protein FlhB [Caulobacteraceae bacterium]
MADESDSSTKTEEASPRKLEEARKQGNVAKSIDVPAFATLAAAAGFLAIAGGWMSRNLAAQLLPFVAHPDQFDLSGDGGVIVMRRALLALAPIVIGVMSAAALAGVGGNLIQTGFMFVPSKLVPDASKLSVAEGFKRLFGLDGMIHFLKSALKIGLVATVAWLVLRPHMGEFQLLVGMDPNALLPLAIDMLKALFWGVLALLGAGALADWFWQRQRFMQRMRMTKEEMKEDFRQSEGDPHIRARLRQMRYERAKKRMMQNVPKATVVVMNPTHYAIALRYEAGDTPAPLCVAKGIDDVAFRIREVAEAHNIPIIEDAPLARALYATVEIDEVIPREHYEAVAKVIGFVMQQAKRRRVHS